MQEPQMQPETENQYSQQPQMQQQQSPQMQQQSPQTGGAMQQGMTGPGEQGYLQGAQFETGEMRQQGTQMQGGQQMGGQRMSDLRLDDALTEHMRVALHDFEEAASATEWCAERCIDDGPQMAECLRLCRDVADIASLNARLIARDSAFGPELVELFIVAAEACAQECAQHQHAHCQECAEVLSRAIQSSREMLTSFQGQQGMQQQGMQQTGQF